MKEACNEFEIAAEQMKKDQEEIDRLRKETREKLDELHGLMNHAWPILYFYKTPFLPISWDPKNTSEIKELRKELDQLTDIVKYLESGMRRFRDNETHEREKLVLRLENQLLKFDNRINYDDKRTEKNE